MKIEPEIVVKIYKKHSVLSDEIEKVLLKDKAIFKKVSGNQYLAIGLWKRYLTIFFEYNAETNEAKIMTAYPPSRKQIKTYRSSRRR